MRNKILIALAAVVVLAAGVAYLIGGKSKSQGPKSSVALVPQVNELPDLEVHMADNSKIYLRDISGDVLLIFFNPDCDHCQEEAREIAASKTMFEKWQVYFITSMEATAAEQFAVDFRLTEPNYRFGHAGVAEVYNSVGALTQVPTILMYKDSRLVSKFEGPGTVDQLRPLL